MTDNPRINVTLLVVHNERINKVVRLSLGLMVFTFRFTFTTAKMSTLMRNSHIFSPSTVLFIGFLASLSLLYSNNASAQDFRMGLAITPNAAWMVSSDYDHMPGASKLNFGYEFIADVLFSTSLVIFKADILLF